ncbi:MAG: sugar phosphate isomerase/epimerase, partial [Allomuricauda sp.]
MKKVKMNRLNLYSGIVMLSIITLSSSCKGEPKRLEERASTEETELNPNESHGGLALYTLRDAMAKNPKETLKKVAEVGYANIEAAGYQDGMFYGMNPEEFNAYVRGLGLNPVSSHQGSVTLETADAMIADVKAAGFQYFVVPVPPMGMFKFNPETREL